MSGDPRPTLLRISEFEPEEFLDSGKLVGRLRTIVHEFQNKPPVIISIEKPGCGNMDIGIGARQGLFLHHVPYNDDLPYLISINGSENCNDTIDYYLFGSHHTEIEAYHIIGIEPALEAVEKFCSSGTLSDAVSWTEI